MPEYPRAMFSRSAMWRAALAGWAAAAIGVPAFAQAPGGSPPRSQQALGLTPASFEAYKAYLAQKARSERVSDATIQAHLPTVRLNMRAIELDRAQMPGPGTSLRSPPLQPYLRRHVTPSLVWRGQSLYYRLWPSLVRIQNSYGVDAATLLAIYGKETSYGRVTGNFDLLDALASLAFEGRRRSLFEAEFLAALKLIDTGVPRETLRGSYAGATGFPQFMPSVVLRLRADGDGDGYADIWRNEVDALASIANYLKDAGWKAGLPWGTPVTVPATLDRHAIRSQQMDSRCGALRRHSRWLTVAQWRALGVVGGAIPDTEMAALLEPEGPGERPFLLTSNYRAILNYNCSNAYATSVALLSDAIARR